MAPILGFTFRENAHRLRKHQNTSVISRYRGPLEIAFRPVGWQRAIHRPHDSRARRPDFAVHRDVVVCLALSRRSGL